ncbi:MAG TPA: xanthine dehydrogenase accessory protein XdhC [Thermoanaerobaculia bacterium]|nr:xanthine dehydrogenase accessory protein XdhC [Thermoanaerobaculia bacterium]
MTTFFETLSELIAAGVPLVTVTVVDRSGSVPQDPGAKMIVTAAGLHSGTVGGGRIETKAIDEAQKMLRGDIGEATRFVQWNLNRDVGMTCGGVVRLYFESHNVARWNIWVFGAGHVGQALVTLLSHLDAQVTCVDPRPEWIGRLPKSPRVRTIVTDDMKSLVGEIPSDAYVALMTTGHATDLPILTEILRTRRFPYLGVIGSRSKAIVLRRDLAAAGLSDEALQSFHCPIGLDIGTNHPFEIAVSIVAQMLGRRGTSGGDRN